jgi:hypothetical protein
MELTKNDREVRYLVVIAPASSVLSLSNLAVQMVMATLTSVAGNSGIVSFGLLFLYVASVYTVPLLPHIPAFVYAVYAREEGMTETPNSYITAFLVSGLFALFLTYPSSPILYQTSSDWFSVAIFVLFVLAIPALHAYLRYDGDLREVVLLFMIYAPWVHFFRPLAEYLLLSQLGGFI